MVESTSMFRFIADYIVEIVPEEALEIQVGYRDKTPIISFTASELTEFLIKYTVRYNEAQLTNALKELGVE